MKKKYILLFTIIILLIVCGILIKITLDKKEEKSVIIEEENKNEKEVIDNLVYQYDQDVYLNEIIEIDSQDKLDTQTLGDRSLDIENYTINYKVVDTKKPIIGGSSTVKVEKGKSINLVNKFMCGDNYDDKPKCYIEGDYDLNTLGTYDLTYVAEDSSGNKSTKKFKLKVINKTTSSSSSTVKRTKISEYIKKYKNEKTKIGIDVSAWQDNIDWAKAKKDGVEFAILRIGYGHTNSGELKLDNWFERNIKEAKKQGIELGVYFYSYAKSEEDARAQAKWIVKKLNGQKLELPIAFDWENWSSFNKYNVSFKHLNDIAYAFIDEVEKNDYEGMLYSSAYYLKNIWKDYDKVWLAYYTDNNDFSKPFNIWQLSSKGKVNGISGSVDIDVLYK